MQNDKHAVEVRGVEKIFRVPHESVNSLKGHATRLFQNMPYIKYEALKGTTFSINKGEFFSIIGANGSGKSTLLKLLAGIYEPTKGEIHYAGSITTMIELGVGFNFELSGRDNIYLNAALFGMVKSEVEKVYDQIVSFAEIEEFIDQKVKNYSSGMQVRLAFAIAIQAKADIIVVDEVLAVGDANFRQKCFDVFRELKGAGKTIIFVSHDLSAVQNFSDRVLLLQHGEQIGIFEPLEAIKRYNEINQQELEALEANATDQAAIVDKVDKSKPHVAGVQLFDLQNHPAKSFKRGSGCKVVVEINNPQLEPIEVGVAIQRNDGLYCFGTNTFIEQIKIPANETTKVTLGFKKLLMQKGTYNLIIGVFSKGLERTYDMQLKAKTFRMSQPDETEGLFTIDTDWEV